MTLSEGNLRAALEAWTRDLGPEGVDIGTDALNGASTATFATTQRVVAILRPASTAGVQGAIRIAVQHGVPLHPVSRGRNWGLGSRVPWSGNAALLDLSRLDRILAYDDHLGYVTLEPGVTFCQVADFLRDNESAHFLPAIGGPPDASVIGNAVERGDGIGPDADRAMQVCALEIVLADGEVLNTGFARFEGARTAPLHRWGVGPYLDGLFLQSSLGVVTRMTCWLTPRPAFMQQYFGGIADAGRLPALIDRLQPLVLRDVLRSHTLTLWNRYKFLARDTGYPFDVAAAIPLGSELNSWMVSGTLYGASRAHGSADRALISLALATAVEELSFLDQDMVPELLDDSLLLGVPNARNLRSLYWRKRGDPPTDADPDRDRCGVLWLCPALPFVGADVARAIREIEDRILDVGFEPNIALVPVSGRCLHAFVAIVYDRDETGEDERARRCHDELLAALIELGYPPYRLGVQSMTALDATTDMAAALLRRLEITLDPAAILAPGRYEFDGPGKAAGALMSPEGGALSHTLARN